MKKVSISLIDAPDPVFENLKKYEAETMIRVPTINLSWNEARQCLGDYALFRSGPDVSCIGVHLLDHFIHMNTIRPFSQKELEKISDGTAYPPVNWEGGKQGNAVYAIPWSTDVRIVFYRRDIFAQLGIDEATAFAAIPDMCNTLEKIHLSGNIAPWVMPTAKELTPMQNMAMWVWHEGGNFMDATGRHPQFLEPQALAGMKQYFTIFRSIMKPEVQFLSETENTQFFREGKAAAALSGTWMLHPGASFEPVVKENLGVTTLPIPSFVGAHSLAIWSYSRNEDAAVELIQYLCQPQTQFDMFVNTSYLPGRLDVIKNPDFLKNKHLAHTYLSALESGRGFKANYMWGLVEDRMAIAINRIWQMLFANPDLDVEETIYKVMKPTSFNLEQMLNP